MKQFIVTPSMGKRLIGKAMAAHPVVRAALAGHTLVIVAGTTNAYVAQEVLAGLGEAGFEAKGFRRGLVVPPSFNAADVAAPFPGDVVITSGTWQRGKQIFDVAADLAEGDVVLKGANAVNLCQRHAAVYIGHPAGGTAAAALPAVVGKRVRLLIPVGVEKRVTADISDLVTTLNTPGVEGPRMMQLPGEVFTELDAIEQLTGATARLLAGGGVCGAEGCVWLGCEGDADQLRAASTLIQSVAGEPLCAP